MSSYEARKEIPVKTKANRRSALVGLLLVLALRTMASAASEKVLYRFHGEDGHGPVNVIIGADGALYGTTVEGGTNACLAGGCGVVFRLTQGMDGKWRETVLHNFAGSDGMYPDGALVADKAGNLYGTTVYGATTCSQLGCGVAFQLKRGSGGRWTYKVLHQFAVTDGANPYAGMIFDLPGNLYGTTSSGGDTSCSPPEGCGVVFKLTESKGAWTDTVVYSFQAEDGAFPYAPLTLDAAGNLYGTTEWGGTYDAGTVFKLTPGKNRQWSEEVLHSFSSDTKDGGQPTYGVIFDSTGSIYGTTQFGGMVGQQGWGTAFKLTPAGGGKWKETILRSFDRDNGPGGGFLSSGLILDAKGNLYGTAGAGGRYNNCGVVFKLTPRARGKWDETVLHSFGRGNDGCDPIGGLVFDSSGRLLGSASIGGHTGGLCGQGGCGVVFEVAP
jgi:uncharacterized repeat protein (TIGR03803 family)